MNQKTLTLFNYHQWANNRMFDHLKTLPEETYAKEIKSIFSSIEQVWQHLVLTDRIYLDVIRGNPFEHTQKIIPEITKSIQSKSKNGLQKMYRTLYKDYHSFFKKTTDLNKVLNVNHPEAGPISISIADIVRQVVNHGTYHRGNIAAMIRQQGFEGINTDYTAYLYQIK